MTGLKQIYKCNVCGNIVELIHIGQGQLVCCGQAMELMAEKNQDIGQEKHVPVLEIKDDEVIVKAGSIPHPMEDSHYIEWIEIISDNGYCRKFLKPGDQPEAVFKIKGNNISSRLYCNLHGLWKS